VVGDCESIEAVGLKKPITVSRRQLPDGAGNLFDLVCGQGRLEAMRELGQLTIPAIIIEADEPERHLMSLIENIARRPSSHTSIYFEVRNLRARGHDTPSISDKLGLDRSYIQGIVHRLNAENPNSSRQ
jgi:ParB family transcriptional regulator, chromosome partitioning protein